MHLSGRTMGPSGELGVCMVSIWIVVAWIHPWAKINRVVILRTANLIEVSYRLIKSFQKVKGQTEQRKKVCPPRICSCLAAACCSSSNLQPPPMLHSSQWLPRESWLLVTASQKPGKGWGWGTDSFQIVRIQSDTD